MNIQFDNRIEIIPREDVDSITEEGIVPVSGKNLDAILAENDLVPTDTPDEINGNPYYGQSLKIVTHKLEPTLAMKYRNRRPVIVQLHRSDNTILIWGDPEIPVRVTFTPYPGHDVLELTRNSTTPLL